jgi:polyisoprenoid-binding protein YceI
MRLKAYFAIAVIAITAFVFTGLTGSAGRATVEERFANAVDGGVTGTYNFDKSHTAIGFKVKHFGLVDVPGYFRDFTGEIRFDAEDPSKSSVNFSAKMASVDTGVAGRDNHLRTADFFEVEKYPEMTFVSKKVEKHGAMWHVTGDLTMKGVTKSVNFPFNIAGFLPDQRSGGTRMGVTAETSINRRDFGVNYGGNLPNGTAMLSDNVKVELNIEALYVPEKK